MLRDLDVLKSFGEHMVGCLNGDKGILLAGGGSVVKL
jgi:hypothetical protein